MAYAQDTDVPSDRSRSEIERTLARYGADQFIYGWEQSQAMVGFRADGRQVRFLVPLPARDDPAITMTPERRRRRSEAQIERAYEQAVRQRWRALALVVKAKLEAVESGITSFEEEFMAHILLPNGQTVGQYVGPQIEEAYTTGQMPPMLPALGPGTTET